MLQNAYFLAKIGADTTENEQHSAEILPTDVLWRLCRQATGRRGLAAAPGRPGARPAANLRGKWNIFESDGEPALVA